MRVKLLPGVWRENGTLAPGHTYEVLGIESDYYRIVTEADALYASTEPLLFDPELFEIVDSTEPEFWTTEYGEDGERYSYPACWASSFFEKYHDGIRQIQTRFWADLKILYPETWSRVYG